MVKVEWDRELEGINLLSKTKQKLERCAKALTAWNQAKYGETSRKISFLTKELEALQRNQKAEGLEEIRSIQGELKICWRWRISGGDRWLKGIGFRGGDRNTKFFHA